MSLPQLWMCQSNFYLQLSISYWSRALLKNLIPSRGPLFKTGYTSRLKTLESFSVAMIWWWLAPLALFHVPLLLHPALGRSGWGQHRIIPGTGSWWTRLFPLQTSSPNCSSDEDKWEVGGGVTKDFWMQFQASVNRNEWEMCISTSHRCVAGAAVNEHGLNHELMNDSSRGLAEVGTIRERRRDAPFTTSHYLNWKEYLYQLGDQELMEAVMHQLSYIKMSAGKGRDNYSLFKDF